MTPLTIGFKLWARAVFLNAAAICIVYMPQLNIFALLVFFVALLFGFILGSPFIIVISWLVKVFTELPYHKTDKFTWLLFALVVTTAPAPAMIAKYLIHEPTAISTAVACGTAIAVVLATLWIRPSLMQLNNSLYETAS